MNLGWIGCCPNTQKQPKDISGGSQRWLFPSMEMSLRYLLAESLYMPNVVKTWVPLIDFTCKIFLFLTLKPYLYRPHYFWVSAESLRCLQWHRSWTSRRQFFEVQIEVWIKILLLPYSCTVFTFNYIIYILD